MKISPRVAPLTSSIALAIALSACGGGGGNTRSDPPPPPPPTPAPVPPPPVCEDDTATNPGGPLPCAYRYNGLKDNILVPINADLAHKAGFTGKGMKVGVLDDNYVKGYAPLEGAVVWERNYRDGEDSEPGHGSAVATSLAGRATGDFSGGVAPDASIYWGQVCKDGCNSDAARNAIVDMAAEGVRIFNASFGGVAADSAPSAEMVRYYANTYSVLKDVDGLLVSSAGNTGKDSPGAMPMMPTADPDFAGHYITAAAGVVDSKGNVTELADFSNKCGAAAEWCITAPSRHLFPVIEGTGFKYGADGTSMAAPVVTGTATLVLQAFPWMSARNLQQTVLTTATDLGEQGVDAVFGWGLVNAERAVRGPAMFTGADFAANVDSGRYTFANDIGGDRGIIKDGAGTLVLAGNNTFAGNAEVRAGVLGIDGDVASSVIATNTGTLIAMGGSIGGDYSAAATATTAVSLGDPLNVGGTAALAGALQLLPAASGYTVGGSERVLNAGSVEGTFDTITYGSGFFFTATPVYDATTVTADLERTSAVDSAQSFGSVQSVIDGAGQADAVVSELDRRMLSGDIAGLEAMLGLAGQLFNASTEASAMALGDLTGSIHGVQRTLGVQTALNDARNVSDRLPHLAGTFAPTFWVQGEAVDGTLERSGYAGADYRQDGLSVGVDVPAGKAVVGASLSQSRMRADTSMGNSRLESDRLALTSYAYRSFGKAYASGVLGYSKSDVDTERTVRGIDGLAGTISGERDESTWTVRLETGFKLDSGLSPFAAVGSVIHKQEAFSERANGGLGLTAGDDTVTANFADVGLRQQWSSKGWTLNGLVAYRNVFDGSNTDFNAAFTGLESAGFTVAGQPLSRESFRAMFGVGYSLNRNVLIYSNVTGERTSSDSNAGANLGLRWIF